MTAVLPVRSRGLKVISLSGGRDSANQIVLLGFAFRANGEGVEMNPVASQAFPVIYSVLRPRKVVDKAL